MRASERNLLNLPVYTFLIDDGFGNVQAVRMPDPGIPLTKPRPPGVPPPFVRHPAFFAGMFKIYAVPVTGGARIKITNGDAYDDRPRWSPDGRLVYFVSTRSGFLNMWAKRFDPVERRAIGDPFPVKLRRSRADDSAAHDSARCVAISRDRVILPIREASGNIWILEGVHH